VELPQLSPPYPAAALAELIRPDAPARPRGLAVLDERLSGRVWADDAASPSATIVIEDADGTVYAGGALTRDVVTTVLADIATASGDLIFGFADAEDALRGLVPAEPYWRGEAIDFTERAAGPDEAELLTRPLPEGARLVRVDRKTLSLTEWYEDTLVAFGSAYDWEEHGMGFAVMIDGRVASESIAGPRSNRMLEMGVVTREPYRQRGFGTLVSLAVARACEDRGDRVWWNANAGNAPSLAIARRLGFRRERRYELVACRAPLGDQRSRT
jgi:RimJ/RimL family protein N-acetyltransferase